MTRQIKAVLRRFRRDESGAAAVLVAASIVAMVGFGALVVDLANVLMAQSIVGASANAAALAGAQEIGNGGNPVTTATTYSSLTGDKNALGDLTVTSVTGYPKLTCATNWATSSGVACSTNYTTSTCTTPPCTPAVNLITVEETANVPTLFGRLFGISSIPVKATATASAQGYAMGPYNVAFVLDTTASMGDPPSGGNSTTACSGYSTAIKCAVAGIQDMLGELWPCASGLASCTGASPVDEVALFVFPPVTNTAQATTDISCTNPQIATYYAGTAGVSQPISTTNTTLNLATSTSPYSGILSHGPSSNANMTTANAFNTGSAAAVTDAGTPTSQATPTTGSTSKTLYFPSGVVTTKITTGMTITDTTTLAAIPSGTTVWAISTTNSTVTMSASATGTGVAQYDLIRFGTSIPAGTGTWPFWSGGTTMASTTPGTPGSATLSAAPNSPGVLQGDYVLVAPVYQITSFANDYRTSDTATTLNASSNVVKVTAQGCLGTPGGLHTYYADAITAAQNALVAEQAARKAAGQQGGQNVIVFLSDGNASSTRTAATGDPPEETNMGPAALQPTTGECQAAVTAARNAAQAGTTVYTVYYDDNGTSTTCSPTGDTGSYTGSAPNGACYTLQQMANAAGSTAGTYVNDQPKLFYSTDGTGSPCPASQNYQTIAEIFQHIVATLTNARLLPVGTD
jgi:Flp pilus assembly protein TadG